MDTLSTFGILFCGPGISCILGLYLSYVYLKQHVYIERQIKKMFVKQMHAQELRHIHPKHPRYTQCHFPIGFNFLIEKYPRETENFFGKVFLEKILPDTISSDFEFCKPQDIENLIGSIQNLLENLNFIVTKDLVHSNSIFVKKKKRLVRVSIIPLICKDTLHVRYRLVCTWISF